jgi:hypothetical protein
MGLTPSFSELSTPKMTDADTVAASGAANSDVSSSLVSGTRWLMLERASSSVAAGALLGVTYVFSAASRRTAMRAGARLRRAPAE